jgi:hypothetical protein
VPGTPRPRRNTRPRDRLGRPLPYGSPGAPQQPEGIARTPREALTEAQRLLDTGFPFAAHEVLEDAWKSAAEDERELWRGLAQLAVGLTHAERGNASGAAALLRRGAASIARYENAAPHDIPVADLRHWAEQAAGAVVGGSRPGPMPRLYQ